jgi:Na+-transporting methylmalonyl-CoA/oxaloacetate decarboxylase beta subunit
MIGVGCALIYLAIKKKYEPLLLLPIGFGAVIVNIPYSGLMEPGGFLRVLYEIGVENDLFPSCFSWESESSGPWTVQQPSTSHRSLPRTPLTPLIFSLGLIAFVSALACGVILAKIVCILTKGKVSPLIWSCGISAFPMAARTAHRIGREEDPSNWLLTQAMATNTGDQIASVIAGGVILTFAPILLGL